MNHTPLYISRDDDTKLRRLLATASPSSSGAPFEKLRAELDRAVVLDPGALPADVVRLESTVQFEDLGTGEIEKYTLTLPDRADVERQRISILAPIGTALLGYSVGDVVNWSTPGGVRQLKIRHVTPPAASSAPVSASPALFASTATR